MRYFVDTAVLSDIQALSAEGRIDGVTTNPSLIAQNGSDFKETIKAICAVTTTPVSAEVASPDFESMIREGETLAALAPNVVVKLPLTAAGLRACAFFQAEGIKTNVTLCFTLNQALAAARAGATFVSPFVGRLEDQGEDGIALLSDIRRAYDRYSYETKILAASIRSVAHIEAAANAGADVVTAPAAVLNAMLEHPLTDAGLQKFEADWRATGQSIV